MDVVLFGVGDMRVDDHVGLYKAVLQQPVGGTSNGRPSRRKFLPLCILNDETLTNIPGAVAHTADTASLLSEALQSLDSDLKEQIGCNLQVIRPWSTGSESTLQTLERVRERTAVDKLRVHVCDLGDADNSMLYGPFGQLSHLVSKGEQIDKDRIEIVSWSCRLREEPWEPSALLDLTDKFPNYEQQYTSKDVQKPITVVASESTLADAIPDLSIGSPEETSIPSADEICEQMVRSLGIEKERCDAEKNTGLYATHWGGLNPRSIASSAVMEAISAYTNECGGRDEEWFRHSKYVGRQCRRNGKSLEHASMIWQLQGKGQSPTGEAGNWLAGESMVRYLAGPLLYGTVSPRRVWHTVAESNLQRSGNALFPNPLKRLVEGQEWHKLLAAHNIRSNPAYGQRTEVNSSTSYSYWRYHGFLCRYAKTDFCEAPQDEHEGVLLVHGFGASGAQWNKAMSELKELQSEHSASMGLAPDLLGFGHAEKPALSYTAYLWDGMITDFSKEQAMAKYNWKSFVVGGNSIGGFTSMSAAACDTAEVGSSVVTSTGAPGTTRCNGLVLMNSAGPILTKDEVNEQKNGGPAGSYQLQTIAETTALGALPACKPPPRPVARAFGNVLLSYLRPRIQSICTNLYPTNPSAVDAELCDAIYRDSQDPGAINVMISGAKLPTPRTANELLQADFGSACTLTTKKTDTKESSFAGPVLVAQGVLDPLNDAKDRMNRLEQLRAGITASPIEAGHCPHDELPADVAKAISSWMSQTTRERSAFIEASQSTQEILVS